MNFEKIAGLSTLEETLPGLSTSSGSYHDFTAKDQTPDEALESLLSHTQKRRRLPYRWFTKIPTAALLCLCVVVVLQLIALLRMKVELNNRIPIHSSSRMNPMKDSSKHNWTNMFANSRTPEC